MKAKPMTLANGRRYLAIPGPSVIPDQVLQAMHIPSPDIYKGELIELTKSLIPELKAVARTEANAVIYIGNGHAAWEAALANVTSRGDKLLVAASGLFGKGWAEMATSMGLDVEVLDFGTQSPADVEKIEAALRADTNGEFKAVLVCHVDTSSSARSDIAAVRAAIDAAGHDALLMVDCIASLACDQYEMDAWGADVTVSACQKGLMTPAGLAFVHFNDKADSRRGDNVSRYWDWRLRVEPDVFYMHFNGTAPTHHLYGLREAFQMIAAEGLENVWRRHEALAQTVWTACDVWGSAGPLALNIAAPNHRSRAVTSLHLPDGQAADLQHWCETQAGLTLGIGLGREPGEDYFRIGHMGHVNAHMIMGVLGTIEAGLTALEIPHGSGALEQAAKTLAGYTTAKKGNQTAQSCSDDGNPEKSGNCC